jgi:plasmid replication initiation protein
MQCIIKIEGPPDKQGKKSWIMHHWFSMSTFNKDTGQATMKFSLELAGFLSELKRMYAKINLLDIGKLQSRYAIRIYEMAISYMSMQGQQGNSSQNWYYERSVEELKIIMGLSEGVYKRTYDFKKHVIEEPIKEINEAGLGIEIKSESIRQGRNLVAMRLNCKKAPRTTGKRGKVKKEMPLPGPNSRKDFSLKEKEYARLTELYPEEFAELYEWKMANPFKMTAGCEKLKAEAARIHACKELKKRYGIRK